MRDKLSKSLKYSQIIFYLAFSFLWFKDNFPSFRKVNLSCLLALVPLIVITIIRIFLRFKQKKISLRIRFGKAILALVVLILIATAVRIPFLVYNFGLVDSDDVIPILVGKHISEGKLPPVYHYGQQYLGTFPYHIYALMFKIFGYSILIVLLVSLIFYLAFITTQFILFKEVFSSSNLSFVLCLFYCLPIGHLLAVSFHIGISFSLVLFLSSLSMFLSFLIYKKNREDLIPILGFFSGFLFWIHPETVVFALSSFVVVALKFRFSLRKYIHLIIYSLIGCFPFILSEIGRKFASLEYIFSGRKIQSITLDKIKTMLDNLTFLVSAEKNFLNFIYIFLIFFGILVIVFLSFMKKKFLPENIFVIFIFVFMGVYILSRYSDVHLAHARYLYPIYFVLPVFLVSAFNLLKRKIKYIPMISLFLIILIFNNINDTSRSYLLVKRAHINLKKIIHAMEVTGEKYWVGDFWQVFLITGLSGEKIICWSYPHERYFPYKLWYFNQGHTSNYVFFRESGSYAVKFKKMFQHISGNLDSGFNHANNLIDFLSRFDINAKMEKIGDFCWLIYDASSQVLPWAFEAPIPEKIPEMELANIEYLRGYLFLTFKIKVLSESSGFRLHIEIPGFSSMVRGFSSDRKELKFRIPFPRRKSFMLRYYLNYKGTQIPSTIQEISCSPLPEDFGEREQRIVYLSGFGPMTEVYGKRMRVCEKEATFEINKVIENKSKVRLHLYSPFQFSHLFWYGEYFQEVRIEVNDLFLTERRLNEGSNIIDLEMKDLPLKNKGNIMTLKFKYHLPFGFMSHLKISALFDRIEFE